MSDNDPGHDVELHFGVDSSIDETILLISGMEASRTGLGLGLGSPCLGLGLEASGLENCIGDLPRPPQKSVFA